MAEVPELIVAPLRLRVLPEIVAPVVLPVLFIEYVTAPIVLESYPVLLAKATSTVPPIVAVKLGAVILVITNLFSKYTLFSRITSSYLLSQTFVALGVVFTR